MQTTGQQTFDKVKVTKSPAVSGRADYTGCQWFSRSCKVDDFHLIWKAVYDFLLMINSNFGCNLHRLATTGRTNFQGHSRSMIFILFETAYATSY